MTSTKQSKDKYLQPGSLADSNEDFNGGDDEVFTCDAKMYANDASDATYARMYEGEPDEDETYRGGAEIVDLHEKLLHNITKVGNWKKKNNSKSLKILAYLKIT